MAIIDTEDVVMATVASSNLSKGHIKWADEQMDIVITEEAKQEYMIIEQLGGEMGGWTSTS